VERALLLSLAATLSVAATSSWSGTAGAVPAPLRLVYGADAECPAAEAFAADVRSRTDRASFEAAPGEEARTFVVDLVHRGPVVRGRVAIEEPDGTVSDREIAGDTCAEVASALSLVIALAVDPHAHSSPAPAPRPPSPAFASAAAEPLASPPALASAPPEAASPASAPAMRPASASTPEPASARAVPPVREHERAGGEPMASRSPVALGVEGELVAGLVPSVLIGGAVFVELAGRRLASWDPSLRLSASIAGTRTTFDAQPSVSPQAVGASLLLSTLRFEVCPARLSLGRRLRTAPCAGMSAGLLRAGGYGLPNATSEDRGWFAPDALVRITADLGGGFQTAVAAGLVFPFVRYSFEYEPAAQSVRSTVGQMPVVAAFVAPAVAYAFP
jgi:hypothetical protein